MPLWLKNFDFIMLLLALGTLVRVLLSPEEEFYGIWLFVGIGILVFRAVVLAIWYYRDARETFNKSILSAIAHAVRWTDTSIYYSTYSEQREVVLKNREAETKRYIA
jgi:hypothetical protein